MSWTIKTLKRYFEQRFDSIDEARRLARKLMSKRLKHMNKIREQLDRQIETFVNKDELALRDQRIETLSKIVYIGMGVFLFLQLLVGAMIIHLMTKP